MGAVAGAGFGHGALDVGAYGQDAEDEFFGDFVVGRAPGCQDSDFLFAWGEVAESFHGAKGVS